MALQGPYLAHEIGCAGLAVCAGHRNQMSRLRASQQGGPKGQHVARVRACYKGALGHILRPWGAGGGQNGRSPLLHGCCNIGPAINPRAGEGCKHNTRPHLPAIGCNGGYMRVGADMGIQL